MMMIFFLLVLIFLFLNIFYLLALKVISNRRNQNHTLHLKYKSIYVPKNLEDLKRVIIVTKNIRPIGGNFGWNDIVNPSSENGHLISLLKFKNIKLLDNYVVEVGAGVTFRELINFLAQHNRTLYLSFHDDFQIGALAAIGSQSLATRKSTLCDYLKEIHLVNGKGENIIITDDHPDFYHYRLSFGVLGVIYQVKLNTDPYQEFEKKQMLIPLGLNKINVEKLINTDKNFALIFNEKTIDCFCDYLEEVPNKFYQSEILKKNFFKIKPLMYYFIIPILKFLLPLYTLLYFYLMPNKLRYYLDLKGIDLASKNSYLPFSSSYKIPKYDPNDIAVLVQEKFKYFNVSFIMDIKYFSEACQFVYSYFKSIQKENFGGFYIHYIRTYNIEHTCTYYPFQRFFSVEVHFTRKYSPDKISEICLPLHQKFKEFQYRIHLAKYVPKCVWEDEEYFESVYRTPEINLFNQIRRREDPQDKFSNRYSKLITGH